MAIRKIVEMDKDDILRKHSRQVTKFDRRLGVLKRVVVIDVGEGKIELVNPEIVWDEGEVISTEGCLSVPGRRGTVKRPEKVRVKAQDRKGNPMEVEGEGLLAVCLCHELDHLEGVLYVDKMIEDVTDKVQEEEEAGKGE